MREHQPRPGRLVELRYPVVRHLPHHAWQGPELLLLVQRLDLRPSRSGNPNLGLSILRADSAMEPPAILPEIRSWGGVSESLGPSAGG
jgi:hypothetical protein